jgi:DNA (cytosine-5)-methyltransferase 1
MLTSSPDSEDSELEITGIYARQAPASSASGSGKKERSARQPKNGPIQPPDSEIHRYELSKGCTIQPGDTIELKDTSRHDGDLNHSGDFLRIKHIIINNQTDEVRLRGLRLRRTKYFQQLFECKYLFSMVLMKLTTS